MATMFALEPLGQTWTEADQTQDALDAQNGKNSEFPWSPLHLATSLHAIPSVYEGFL